MQNSIPFRRRLFSGPAFALTLTAMSAFTLDSQAVGTRHFVIESSSDFSAGELEGVAVDSRGFLRAGLDLGAIEIAGADNVWAAVEHEGELLLATGSEGKLLSVRNGKTTEVASVPDALALTDITHAFGKVIVGSMPGGKLYELKGKKLVEFAELKDAEKGPEHIWAMSYDAKVQALFVATGPHGKLYRITADGTAQVYFDAEQGHLVSVLASEGKVYTGSSGEARLYEVSGPGRAQVLYDFAVTEVRGIVADGKGGLVVAVNELKGGPRSDALSKARPKGPAASTPQGGSGHVYRFDENGQPEKVYSDKGEHFIALELDEKGRPLVGTGKSGRVIRLEQDHKSVVIADVEERQVSAVMMSGKNRWVVASDPIVVHAVEGVGGADALWTSQVLDAGIRARFGRMNWDVSGKVEVTTRSGNTKKPDETWSDWSKPVKQGAPVSSKSGRYLQVRTRLIDSTSLVQRIDIPFVTDNLRAVLTEVSAKSGNETTGSKGVAASGAPPKGKTTSKVKLSWKVDNPDEDTLRYRVEYRLESSKDWFDALDPGQVLKSTSLEWDTKDLPEGKYRVQVLASDELSNPPSRVKHHSMESEQILVDNTAPEFVSIGLEGGKLIGAVKDGVGPIQRLEFRVAGTEEWVPFEPKDGIFDQLTENFSLDLSSLVPPEKNLVTVRAFDTGGNKEVRHVRLPVAR